MNALCIASTTSLQADIQQIRDEVRQHQFRVNSVAAEFEAKLAGHIASENTIASKLQAIRQRLMAY